MLVGRPEILLEYNVAAEMSETQRTHPWCFHRRSYGSFVTTCHMSLKLHIREAETVLLTVVCLNYMGLGVTFEEHCHGVFLSVEEPVLMPEESI